MQRSQYVAVLIALAMAAATGAVLLLKDDKSGAALSPETALVNPTTPDEKSSGSSSKKDQEAKPRVYFLDEAGAEAPSNRPQANLLPKANGTARLTNSRAITTPEEGDFMAPQWSPDGLEVMFSKAGYSGLYTKGILGGDINQVTGKDNIGYGAEWTKDGKIVTKTNSGERQEFNPDGSPASGIDPISNANVTGAFNTNDTVFYRENPGEAPVPISSGEDRYFGGVVSPDGKYIAYNGLETGIYVKPVDGSAPAVHIGEGSNPTFTPDSGALIYSVTQDDGEKLIAGNLYMSSLDGKNVSNLTDGSSEIAVKPAVSPDGQQIAYEADGQIKVADLN